MDDNTELLLRRQQQLQGFFLEGIKDFCEDTPVKTTYALRLAIEVLRAVIATVHNEISKIENQN